MENSQIKDNIELEIDNIRKKTFNSELKNLVDKINSPQENSLTTNDEYEILKNIHTLFYKTINLQYSNEVSKYNFLENLTDFENIKNYFQSLNVENCGLLEYDPNEKIYKITNSTFKSRAVDDLIISPSENIFKIITSSSIITKLTDNLIQKYNLSSRFYNINKMNLYFISMRSMFLQHVENYPVMLENYNTSQLLPILIFSIPDSIEEDTMNMIENDYAQLYFFMMNKEIDYIKSSLENIFNQLEKYSYEKIYDTAVHCFILKIDISKADNYYFTLKFFENQMKKIISIKSRYLMINLNTFAGFFTLQDSRKVLEEVEKFNSTYNNPIEIIRIKDFYRFNLISEIFKINS